MNTRVRGYKNEDFEQLIELYKDKSSYGGKFDPGRDTAERFIETSRQGNLFVAYDGEELAGSFMVLDNPHSFWLIRFAVKNNNLELANELSEHALELAKDRGHESVIVYTESGNLELNQRYQSLGFNQTSDYTCFWKDVGGRKNDV